MTTRCSKCHYVWWNDSYTESCPRCKLESNDMRVWDLYAAHALGSVTSKSALGYAKNAEVAANYADALLAERRKRMGQAGASSDNVSTGTAGGKEV